MDGARLNRAYLRGAHFEDATLHRANLEHADCERANFDGAELTEANLRGSCLDQAWLVGATLRNTDLTGASMFETFLPKTVLRGVRGITSEELIADVLERYLPQRRRKYPPFEWVDHDPTGLSSTYGREYLSGVRFSDNLTTRFLIRLGLRRPNEWKRVPRSRSWVEKLIGER